MAEPVLPPGVADAIRAEFIGTGGGGGSSGETFGPMQYEPSIGKYIQIGSRGTVRVVADPAVQAPARDPSGYDPSTGLPYGVTRVSTTVSPTGLVYQGIPVNPDGSPYTGSTSQVANYTGIKEGPGGLWGLNTNTGKYEKIPGSETLGKPASSGPATYSGGGGYTIPRDYIGEANAKAAGQVQVAQAEGAARAQVAQAEAQAQMERDAAQYGFAREQDALSRAFQAAQQAWQGSVTNRQLQQQEEAAKRQAANDFRSAVSDTDPIAFAALMKGWGNLENAIRGGGTAVTDRALAGAAGLLDLIRRPFTPIPGFTWNEPTGAFVPNDTAGGATGGAGATVPGLTTGGNGDASPGAATPGAPQDIPMTPQQRIFDQLQTLHQVGYDRPPTPEELALFWNISQGRGQDPLVTGNYSGIWQSVDPSAPNWRPPYEGYEIPGFKYNWETNQNERIGTPATGAVIPGLASGEVTGAGTPAIGGYTPPSSPVARGAPAVYIPGLAGGGMAKGAFIVGEGSRSNPSEHSELVIAPQGAHVVPLNKPQAKRLLNGGLRSYATGTAWRISQAVAKASNAANPTSGSGYTAPVNEPEYPVIDYAPPQSYPVFPAYTPPQPTYTPPPPVYTYTPPPQPTYTPPPPVYTPPVTTGGNGTTTVAAPPIPSSAASSPSSAPPTAAPPVVNTTNTAAVATAPSTTTTTNTAPPAAPAPVPTTVSGLVNYGGQQVTPDFQALLDEIRNFRTDPAQNVYDRTLNPYDVSFNTLDPISQEVFYRGRQAEFGIPVLAQQWEQQRFRLPGLSRGQVGIGY